MSSCLTANQVNLRVTLASGQVTLVWFEQAPQGAALQSASSHAIIELSWISNNSIQLSKGARLFLNQSVLAPLDHTAPNEVIHDPPLNETDYMRHTCRFLPPVSLPTFP